ncbi:MAG TPA: D-alanyl-D-alanine carboxypeptidase/D-alanyl-D-alanine-endopeptidase [Sphingomonas sp.]|uniref:D-alanyl-D-alanine carboxypeptidase/D-alanyl-D-alanine endopeptidase n=1 Tax=Sphingomonas sp. TaxID=28214 RepID=UPI002CE4029B|nr:D-alanyl-D-alanine carboxypeptidase/D-alanyl-D-alanine-endopeptidase [Sphingomonas sp.]HMI18103.1 D-alanyl-D-alanine carboxypeptidase/D-alanyl-D-alanine-endopeptidase [Sphingomonas sp.]
MIRGILLVAALLPLAAATAQAPLQDRVETILKAAGPGPRYGLVVADDSGKELIAIDPDGRYIPASNTKMFTTAAVFATLDGLDQPDATGGAAVRLETYRKGPPDVVLEGHGDARLSSAADCATDCLATLADAVAAKAHSVHDVIGDDSLFPDERWSQGMSWNNIPTRSGTATSALTLDDNEVPMTVTPGAIGTAPTLDLPAYYTVDNRAVTVAGDKVELDYTRDPNGLVVRLVGTIGASAKPELFRMGIDDPARYAAWRLQALLAARGVKVTGTIAMRHRPLAWSDDIAHRDGAPPMRPPPQAVLAKLTLPPLYEDLIHTNKISQNLHAELFLRRVSIKDGSGSVADGLAVVRAMLAKAGVPRADYDFADGSGMSSYNRVAPRGAVIFLRWVAAQPWGATWRATLPVGGEPSTLGHRFRGTPLEGKLFAKTGTLNQSNALSGYMIAKSGRTLTFSSYANDVPENVRATRAVDEALNLIAAEN